MQPVLGTGVEGYAARFLDGGLATNEIFGAQNPGILNELEPYGVYATLVPESGESFVTFGFNPEATLIRESLPFPAVGTPQFLIYAGPKAADPIPGPTVYPEPELTLPEVGSIVNFAFNGQVEVVISPPAAAQAGAGWFLAGRTPVYPGSTVAEDIPAGEHLLNFTRIPGWLPPRDQMITVKPGGITRVEAAFVEAPTEEVGGIAPQRVRFGDVLGFNLPFGSNVELVGGNVNGTVLISPSGSSSWFSYEPADNDRVPFDLRFTSGGLSQVVTITPIQELPEEQTILALEPVADVPSSTGRDYTFIHTAEAAEGVNYRAAGDCREVTISGVTLIFEEDGDPQLYDLVHDKKNISELNLYVDEIIIRSRLKLQATNVRIFARRLVFEDGFAEPAGLDTSAVDHTASDNGDPEAGGNLTLRVLEIVSTPSAQARLVSQGADTTTNSQAGDSGELKSSFDLTSFADLRGGSSDGGADGTAFAVTNHEAGIVPDGLAWIHPLAVRSVILYARDIYYLGFMNESGELLREYQGYLEELTAIEGLPSLPDADLADLQLAEQFTDISGLVDSIADRLDYFGNTAGWVPLLSFEANFNLTENTIGRAMRAFYLAHWLSAAENTITDRRDAMFAARDALSEETDELKAEFSNVRDEIEDLEDQAVDIDRMTRSVEEELREVERRLEQRAEEIVADRNNVPYWKTALRTAGSIMRVVPFYQPALGAAGGALEIGSRIDEQEPLDTVLQATDLALQYQVANYDQQAQDIDDELNPPEQLSDRELERDELRGKADNVRTAANGVATAGSALREYLASREVAADEVEAELAQIRAADPQFNGVISRLQELMDQKERFARRVASLEDRLREIPGIILKNRIAIITLGDSIDAGNTVLDPQALSVVKEMEARNKDRLRRYFYLLAKSFEYRLLEPYREEGVQVYDPVQVLDKIKEILIASQSGDSSDTVGDSHHVLSPAGFESLRSVLEEELALLSERIIEGYESGENREQTAPFNTRLLESELECLNKPGTSAILNLHKRGVYSAGEEAHRIADLRVTNVDFALTLGGERVALDDPRLENLTSGTIDLSFVHSGLSRLNRKGQTYSFNHFRNGDPDQNPIHWTAKVNLLTGDVIMVRPSLASESLLRTLLGTENQLDILNFSRPGANADIFVNSINLNPGFTGGLPPAGLGVEFTRIDIEAQLDYYFATAERLVDVRVIDPTGAALEIMPRMLFDDADSPLELISDDYGRRDSLGMVSRSFREVDHLQITAEEFYGSELASESAFPSGYRFSRWLDQSFNPISTENVVTIENEGHKRVYAIYERIGDVEAPEVEEFRPQETSGNLVTYEVEFSENVVGVDVTDFAVEGQLPGVGIRDITGSGRTRRVTVDASRFPAGPSRLLLADNDSILDFTGNSLAGDGPGNGNQGADFTGVGGFQVRFSDLRVIDGNATFRLEGFVGRPYRVESSNTLEGGWDLVEEVMTNRFGEAQIVDEGAGRRRFYRVMELP